MSANDTFQRLKAQVIDAGLCTHCGTCVALSQGTLQMCATAAGPLPTAVTDPSLVQLSPLAYEACPGKGIHYPAACQHLFGRQPENWLVGCYQKAYIGYSAVSEIRRRGASGGVITQTLVYLLESGRIDGAVVLRLGRPKPWLAEPIIARSADEIIAASQSVYAPAPVNTIFAEMETFDGRLAYVGLPDQVAALRCLQRAGHAGANKVEYVLGPYVGTNMYLGAIESYLRTHGIHTLEEIAELKFREGEWPGHLYIRTRSGHILTVEKFYYNYLIPFYITYSSLTAVDFTNELTDISVGDAWHPRYEAQGGGFSVVIARSTQAEEMLQAMAQAGLVTLEEIPINEALAMHGHMLDFKKRGAFIRLGWRQALGRPVPDYGYHPVAIPLSRRVVEVVIVSLFWVCGTVVARRLVELVPLRLIGPLFDLLRKAWKRFSRPVKRKGLAAIQFEVSA